MIGVSWTVGGGKIKIKEVGKGLWSLRVFLCPLEKFRLYPLCNRESFKSSKQR